MSGNMNSIGMYPAAAIIRSSCGTDSGVMAGTEDGFLGEFCTGAGFAGTSGVSVGVAAGAGAGEVAGVFSGAVLCGVFSSIGKG